MRQLRHDHELGSDWFVEQLGSERNRDKPVQQPESDRLPEGRRHHRSDRPR